jgi:rhodanese-related sulfurtransferase
MTVLKVMFTAIVVASVLIFLATSIGLLDFERIWVNPTYLYPGIVGGLIMGVGFIIGGFCPGTSLVAAATGKVDGLIFVLGVGLGVFAFGESVQSFEGFFNSSHMGRFMLPELLGISTGWTVLALVLMALAMFYGAEVAEEVFGRKRTLQEMQWLPHGMAKAAGAVGLVALGFLLAFRGQPSAEEKWHFVAAREGAKLERREAYVNPAEVVELEKDPTLYVRILDVRDESDYNLFHLTGSERLSPETIAAPGVVRSLISVPENTVYFLVSNDEEAATRAWQLLKGSGLLNLYIVEGGINRWLAMYPLDPCVARRREGGGHPGREELNFEFQLAVGERDDSAHPYTVHREPFAPCPVRSDGQSHIASFPDYRFVRKVQLERKVAVKGGCG